MLTTAGMLRSNMGAKEGKACPSANGGKPAADELKELIKPPVIINVKHNFLSKDVFIKASQNLLNKYE